MVATKLPLPMLSQAVNKLGRVVLTALMYMTAATYIYSTMVQVTQVRQPRQRRMQGRMYEVGHPDHDRIQLHSILGATLENFLEIPGVK